MIHFEVLEDKDFVSLEDCLPSVKRLFFNCCTMLNSGGGLPVITEVTKTKIVFYILWVQGKKPSVATYPFDRMKKIVTAANAIVNLGQKWWPVVFYKDVFMHKYYWFFRIEVSEEADAIWQQKIQRFYELLHTDLHFHPRSSQAEVEDIASQVQETTSQVDHLQRAPGLVTTLGGVSRTGVEEMPEPELETEPDPVDEDLI